MHECGRFWGTRGPSSVFKYLNIRLLQSIEVQILFSKLLASAAHLFLYGNRVVTPFYFLHSSRPLPRFDLCIFV